MSQIEDSEQIYFVDFEVEKEVWNRYKVEDGALLKLKFVLINLVSKEPIESFLKKAKEEGTKAVNLSMQSTNPLAIQVPSTLRGKPSNTACTIRELGESVVEEDLDFETVAEAYNVYRLNFPNVEYHLYLKIKIFPVRISRTSKFDQYGIPLYLMQTKTDVKISLKK